MILIFLGLLIAAMFFGKTTYFLGGCILVGLLYITLIGSCVILLYWLLTT